MSTAQLLTGEARWRQLMTDARSPDRDTRERAREELRREAVANHRQHKGLNNERC